MSQRQILDKLTDADKKQEEKTELSLELSRAKSSHGHKGAIPGERKRLPDSHPSISTPETFDYDAERDLWGYGVLPAKEKDIDRQQPSTCDHIEIQSPKR